MDRLRSRWWIFLITTAFCSLAIVALAPKYTSVQTAPNAAAFIKHVADAGKGRTTAASFADDAFFVLLGLVVHLTGLVLNRRASSAAAA